MKKYEYLVMVQHKYQVEENRWSNVGFLTDGKRYYDTLEEAEEALRRYVAEWNRGRRTETTKCGGVGIDLEVDKVSVDRMIVVHWYIKKREVTPWEEVGRA